MKVLFVQKMAGVSGSERYFLSYLPALVERGVEVAFLVVQHPANARKNTDFIRQLEAGGVDVHVLDSRLSVSPQLAWRLWRLVRRLRIDVLQTNLIHADVWGACVKRVFMPCLRIVSVKHGYEDSFQAAHGLDPRFIRHDLMSVMTRWLRDTATRS